MINLTCLLILGAAAILFDNTAQASAAPSNRQYIEISYITPHGILAQHHAEYPRYIITHEITKIRKSIGSNLIFTNLGLPASDFNNIKRTHREDRKITKMLLDRIKDYESMKIRNKVRITLVPPPIPAPTATCKCTIQ